MERNKNCEIERFFVILRFISNNFSLPGRKGSWRSKGHQVRGRLLAREEN